MKFGTSIFIKIQTSVIIYYNSSTYDLDHKITFLKMKFMITIVKTSRFRIKQARDSDATATVVLYTE